MQWSSHSQRSVHRFHTLLGSCIGLILCEDTPKHDRLSVAGLAHILLPNAPTRTDSTARTVASADRASPTDDIGRYADTAVPHLLKTVRQSLPGTARLVAHIAGGANMFSSRADARNVGAKTIPNAGPADSKVWFWQDSVGEQNIRAIRTTLRDLQIPIASEDCGGEFGRMLSYDLQSRCVSIRRIPNPLSSDPDSIPSEAT